MQYSVRGQCHFYLEITITIIRVLSCVYNFSLITFCHRYFIFWQRNTCFFRVKLIKRTAPMVAHPTQLVRAINRLVLPYLGSEISPSPEHGNMASQVKQSKAKAKVQPTAGACLSRAAAVSARNFAVRLLQSAPPDR